MAKCELDKCENTCTKPSSTAFERIRDLPNQKILNVGIKPPDLLGGIPFSISKILPEGVEWMLLDENQRIKAYQKNGRVYINNTTNLKLKGVLNG